MKDKTKKLQKISELFYDLIIELRSEQFDFCAYVIEDAYQFYMIELEKRMINQRAN